MYSDSSEYMDLDDSREILQHMSETLTSPKARVYISRLRQLGPHIHRIDIVNVVAAYGFNHRQPPSWFMQKYAHWLVNQP